jgi:phospholipid/cholesterol/gamma-HCH transport system permease protein
MIVWLGALGARVLQWVASLGHAAYFFADLVRFSPAALRRFGLVVSQVHAIGNRSLVIIMASGMAVGFVLALQMYYALVKYGAAESLGLVVNLSLVRELGLMKAGEQISAMELMAIDPRARVLAPRFIGGIVAMPILALLFSAIGIVGAYIVAVLMIGIDAGNFWSIQQTGVDIWRDVGNGIVKSCVFGVICTFVALYQGYETSATPEGVAYATTRTVVVSSLSVLVMDFILTALMFSTP